jgi:hypothetical protein
VTNLDALSTEQLAARLAGVWQEGKPFYESGRIDWLVFAKALKGEPVEAAWKLHTGEEAG